MQEYEQFKAVKEKGILLQKKTFKAYPSFKAGLVLIVLGAGGLAFDMANMVDWITYGCSVANILLHILAAAALAGVIVAAVILMRSGGRKYLLRPAEVTRIYNDHIYVQFVPYKKKKDRVHLNIYYCDIRAMEYSPIKHRVCIDSPAQIRIITDKKGELKTDSLEPEKGNYFLYDWYNGYGTMLDLIEEKSLKKIAARPSE